MMGWRRLILGIIGASFCTGVVCADMMPISRQEVAGRQVLSISDQTEVQYATLFSLDDSLIIGDLDLAKVQFLPRAGNNMGQPYYSQQSIDLTGGPGSYSLCLYALMGMGLCSAPRWAKKLSFGHIPEWFHSGGPQQIGHKFAVNPDFPRTNPVFCFIQPVFTMKDSISQYRIRTFVPSWGESQFAPNVFASRGPPLS